MSVQWIVPTFLYLQHLALGRLVTRSGRDRATEEQMVWVTRLLGLDGDGRVDNESATVSRSRRGFHLIYRL